MYIKEININKYKKLSSLSIEFGQLNIIIGKNNAGKTTLLRVIKSFLDNDAKMFKGYLNEGGESVGISIITNTGEWILDMERATPKWVRTENAENAGAESNYGFLSAHTSISELEKTLQKGAAGFVVAGNENLIPSIDRMLGAYEVSTDLDHSEIITEEGDDYRIKFSFDLSKAITLKFGDTPNSISNKGLGQQKEFVLRQFSGENPLSVDILLIDEIENSLSETALVNILISLKKADEIDEGILYKGEEELQVIASSHNTNSISREISPNIILLGNEAPEGILKNLGNEIFVEGPSDARALSSIFPGNFFIPGGGSNLPVTVRAVVDQGGDPKVIVDGDGPGLNYKRIVDAFLRAPAKSLTHGTIEDYYDVSQVKSVFDLYGITYPTVLPNNLLISVAIPTTTKTLVKRDIQLKDIDETKIHLELDTYIAS